MTVKMTQLTYKRGATVDPFSGNATEDRIDLSVTMEIDGENPDEVLETARKWVKAKLAAAMKDD